MREVGVYEAKTHLSRLLEEVERGESVTISRHGRPVARLVPVAEGKPDVAETIAAIREFRRTHSLGGISVRELIDEGRRF